MALSDLSKAQLEVAFNSIYSGMKTKAEVAEELEVHKATVGRWYNKQLVARGVQQTQQRAQKVERHEHYPTKEYIDTTTEEITSQLDVLGDMEKMREVVLEVLEDARANKRHHITLQAVDRILKVVDTLAQVSAEARRVREESIRNHPEYKKLIEALTTILKRHPELEEELKELLSE